MNNNSLAVYRLAVVCRPDEIPITSGTR